MSSPSVPLFFDNGDRTGTPQSHLYLGEHDSTTDNEVAATGLAAYSTDDEEHVQRRREQLTQHILTGATPTKALTSLLRKVTESPTFRNDSLTSSHMESEVVIDPLRQMNRQHSLQSTVSEVVKPSEDIIKVMTECKQRDLHASCCTRSAAERFLSVKKSSERAVRGLEKLSSLFDQYGIGRLYYSDVVGVLRSGALIVPHTGTTDNTGAPIVIVRCSDVMNDAQFSHDDMMRGLLFVLEVLYTDTLCTRITVVVDMTNVTWRNLRMQRVRSIVETLTNSYPMRIQNVVLHKCEGMLTTFLLHTVLPQWASVNQKLKSRLIITKGVWSEVNPEVLLNSQYKMWEETMQKHHPECFPKNR